MLIPFKKESLISIPEKSGVYFFYNIERELVYIGKAVNLRKRLASYFKSNYSHGILFPESIEYIEYFITKNEKEAYFLERDFIKNKTPKYNIKLKDDKNFLLLKVKINEEFPYIMTARRKTDSDSLYFGPYVPASYAYKILRIIGKAFKIRTCKEKIGKRKRPCLDYFLGLCSAPCVGKISKEEYEKSVKNAINFLNGKIEYILENLKEKMKKASDSLEFEKAAEIRDLIFAIKNIEKKTYKNTEIRENYDIWGYRREYNSALFSLLRADKNGNIKEKKEFYLKNVFISDEELLLSILSEFYFKESIPKRLIIVSKLSNDIKKNLISFLSSKSGKKIKISEGRGTQFKQIIENLNENIEIKFKEFEKEDALKEMKKELKLKRYPEVIEAYDISHLSGTNIVGSKVSFYRGEPAQKGYRRYFISKSEKANDPQNIYRIIKRRLSSKRDKKVPDLLLIDGGIAQLNAAKRAMEEIGIDIDIISISKGKKDTLHLLTGRRIQEKNTRWFKILKFARNEAHRFAIKYQRMKRKDY